MVRGDIHNIVSDVVVDKVDDERDEVVVDPSSISSILLLFSLSFLSSFTTTDRGGLTIGMDDHDMAAVAAAGGGGAVSRMLSSSSFLPRNNGCVLL
jgi:hypothetical protein